MIFLTSGIRIFRNGVAVYNDVPDFQNEDDVWIRTPEEKVKAFSEASSA